MAGSNYTNFELDLSKKILNLLKVCVCVNKNNDRFVIINDGNMNIIIISIISLLQTLFTYANI